MTSNKVYRSLSYADQNSYHREIEIELPSKQAFGILEQKLIYFNTENCTVIISMIQLLSIILYKSTVIGISKW